MSLSCEDVGCRCSKPYTSQELRSLAEMDGPKTESLLDLSAVCATVEEMERLRVEVERLRLGWGSTIAAERIAMKQREACAQHLEGSADGVSNAELVAWIRSTPLVTEENP